MHVKRFVLFVSSSSYVWFLVVFFSLVTVRVVLTSTIYVYREKSLVQTAFEAAACAKVEFVLRPLPIRCNKL